MLRAVSGRRPRLATAPIYELWLDEQWQLDERYRLKPWFRWGWCRLDEVVKLVRHQFGVGWTHKEFLQRWAIPKELGAIQFGQGGRRMYDLSILWITNDGELHFGAYDLTDLTHALDWKDRVAYVPVGWVRDIFWAMHVGCERAYRNEAGLKCAQFSEENFAGFFMTGAGRMVSSKST